MLKYWELEKPDDPLCRDFHDIKVKYQLNFNRDIQRLRGEYTDDGDVPVTCSFCGELRPMESVSCCKGRKEWFENMVEETAQGISKDFFTDI